MQTAGDNATVRPTTSATPSRRALLGAAAVLPLAAVPAAADAAPAGDDAEILRLYAEFEPIQRREMELSRAYGRVVNIPDEVTEKLCELSELNQGLAEQIADLRATTFAALRAKAFVLSAYLGYTSEGAPMWVNHDELLGWSIARDLCGEAAVDPKRRFA